MVTELYVFHPLTDLSGLVLIARQSSKKSRSIKVVLRPRKRAGTSSVPLHSVVQRKTQGQPRFKEQENRCPLLSAGVAKSSGKGTDTRKA